MTPRTDLPPRDELEALLRRGIGPTVHDNSVAAAWLERHGPQVLALIDAAHENYYEWARYNPPPMLPPLIAELGEAVAPLISPPQPEGDT